jgi:hypothetical protein
MTLLSYATGNMKCPAIGEILLEYGADPNIPADCDNESAFYRYCTYNLFEYPQLLDTFLKHGADVNQRDKWGNTVINNIFCRQITNVSWIDDHKKALLKKLIQSTNYDIINCRNNDEQAVLSRLYRCITCATPEYVNHIFTVLLELGANPCDEMTLAYYIDSPMIPADLKIKVEDTYLKFMPKWKEECKNYIAFKKFEYKHYIKPIKEEKAPVFDEKLLNRIRNYTYTWDVSRIWKVWWVLSKDVAAKKEQEEIARLMNIEC